MIEMKETAVNIDAICQHLVVAIDSGRSVTEAAALMRDHHVGALVVTAHAADGDCVAGIVTDRDLVIHVLANGLDAGATEVGTLASERLVSVNELDDLSDAVQAMQDSGVRRLLVTDDAQALTGIVTLDDLLTASASQFDGIAKIIRNGIRREVAENTPPALVAPPALRVPAMGTAGWGNPA